MIPYGKQNISQDDIDAVIDALTSDFITQGPRVTQFEHAVAEKVGAKHAIAVNSATSALHIACLALGLSKGQRLWTSPNTFVASANCGLYCGAKVDFVDIDPITYNLCPKRLAAKLELAKRTDTLPNVVVVIHMCGQSCDMEAIHLLSQQYGFRIIEDASHAIGSKYQDLYVGNCQYSDITVFSFHPVKIITTAEGGMALTNNPKLAKAMENLRSHGITRDSESLVDQGQGAWYYEQQSLGFNYRMTDLQAALGISQLAKLDAFVERRQTLADRYNQKLSALPLTTPTLLPESKSAWHLYVIQLAEPDCRQRVFDALRAKNIGVHVHYIPVHTQPYYRALGFKWGQFPVAEHYYHAALSLPLYVDMTEEEQDTVIQALADALY
ncbi:UDP-4-amino-4,6-dideoxy-N-acetyl-beta-L-altrosamine transaminase [Grimontia hollisae]|uniref:UDP-4-amino-4-deoxy-L-arabinose--oxoglutarate aminotransferase n=1 Tax=Grimontia hollisae TaxID=673 RepID=A0A377HLS0_GRIHO|nr:UDP-4-amino-4,6-dideoxy-N-acetyl-beta-L-altrosamine transaminase [Grimontia hollisae]MDF2184259.1 UDP-4-amino-4,6-dideoxy-N-acetyl-beta-L-altrosamine transaminase [Grimontia hollisae]STO57034.1 UDP-4-amino-4-deoxy-L-arabinose--oxoglutarate aminotransferase [Grimontia hollisae]STQ74896.1 UDP-4-amino-4-deoxy-L-arabinose--oxoglutarate aminotransferase [Grimontia hollisae]